MLNFFRRKRQKLLKEDKQLTQASQKGFEEFSKRISRMNKYIIYAIGEILLVVIGILIALQINNWNLKQIDKKEEIEILEGIVENIRMDSIDLNFNINHYGWTMRDDSLLYSHLTNKKKYHDTIAWSAYIAAYNDLNLTLHKSSFDAAKQRGLEIISNKELRNRISRFYEFDYESVLRCENNSQYFNHYGFLHPALSGYLEPHPDVLFGSPNISYISEEKYNQLLNDKNAHHKLLMSWTLKKQLVEQIYIPTQAKALDLVDEINQELMSLKENL